MPWICPQGCTRRSIWQGCAWPDDDHLTDTAVRRLEATGAGREPGKTLRTELFISAAPLEASSATDPLHPLRVSACRVRRLPACSGTEMDFRAEGGSTCSRASKLESCPRCATAGGRHFRIPVLAALAGVSACRSGVRYDDRLIEKPTRGRQLNARAALAPGRTVSAPCCFRLAALPTALAGGCCSRCAYAGSPCRILARRSGLNPPVRARDARRWNGCLPPLSAEAFSDSLPAWWCPPRSAALSGGDVVLGFACSVCSIPAGDQRGGARPQRQRH